MKIFRNNKSTTGKTESIVINQISQLNEKEQYFLGLMKKANSEICQYSFHKFFEIIYGKVTYSIVTNTLGNFSLSNCIEGKYTLTVSLNDFSIDRGNDQEVNYTSFSA